MTVGIRERAVGRVEGGEQVAEAGKDGFSYIPDMELVWRCLEGG